MNHKRISFIGAGNLASSLIGGLLNDGYPAACIRASHPNAQVVSDLISHFGIEATTDNKEACLDSDIIVLCVKPNKVALVSKEISDVCAQSKPLIISVAAGVSLACIEHCFKGDMPVVRAMPNTASMVGSGATALIANQVAADEHKQWAESVMRSVGVVVWLQAESQIDAVTAISASGLAYYFYIMEIFEQTAVSMGLSEEAAHLLGLQTALGASHMGMQSNLSLNELRQKVTSPGGTTESALQVLQQGQLEDILRSAVAAARDKAQEMAQAHANQRGDG